MSACLAARTTGRFHLFTTKAPNTLTTMSAANRLRSAAGASFHAAYANKKVIFIPNNVTLMRFPALL